MCFSVFMMYLHANNILSTPLHQEFFGVFIFFSFFSFLSKKKKNKYDPMFSQGFLGNQNFNIKTKIKLVFVIINKF
jgi:hypothetical protein